MSYESPIKIITTGLQMKMEGEVLKAVQSTGVHVDKEELIKALEYDRDQYKKGYDDGTKERRWIPCEEDLPRSAGGYMVTLEDVVDVYDGRTGKISYTEFKRRTAYARFTKAKGWNVYGPRSGHETVVAWSERPEPWKGE